jgi:hypothetical protein
MKIKIEFLKFKSIKKLEFATSQKSAAKSSSLITLPTSSLQSDDSLKNDDFTIKSEIKSNQTSTIILDDADESDLIAIKRENKAINTQTIIQVSCT